VLAFSSDIDATREAVNDADCELTAIRSDIVPYNVSESMWVNFRSKYGDYKGSLGIESARVWAR
jgi:hypothetical protein